MMSVARNMNIANMLIIKMLLLLKCKVYLLNFLKLSTVKCWTEMDGYWWWTTIKNKAGEVHCYSKCHQTYWQKTGLHSACCHAFFSCGHPGSWNQSCSVWNGQSDWIDSCTCWSGLPWSSDPINRLRLSGFNRTLDIPSSSERSNIWHS